MNLCFLTYVFIRFDFILILEGGFTQYSNNVLRLYLHKHTCHYIEISSYISNNIN